MLPAPVFLLVAYRRPNKRKQSATQYCCRQSVVIKGQSINPRRSQHFSLGALKSASENGLYAVIIQRKTKAQYD